MPSNVQKTPLLRSLNDLARQRAGNAVQRLGKTLPCSVTAVRGSIVTVKFEVLDPTFTLPPATMPIMGPEYIRYPIQIGCKGMAIAADAYLGGMSGLGTGIATLADQPNLSALVFMPVGNADFFSVDGNLLVLYGPDGVLVQDQAGDTSVHISNAGTVTIKAAHTVIQNLPTAPGVSGELWRDAGSSNVVRATP